MTLASIMTPDWVSYSVTANTGNTFSRHIGLHRSCGTVVDPDEPLCRPFPSDKECAGEERSFCSMWRTTGFLMSFATVVELATVVCFLIIMAGGKMKREKGWRVLGVLLAVVAGIQFCAMAIVVGRARQSLRCLQEAYILYMHCC
jgi:hypothetical protein